MIHGAQRRNGGRLNAEFSKESQSTAFISWGTRTDGNTNCDINSIWEVIYETEMGPLIETYLRFSELHRDY